MKKALLLIIPLSLSCDNNGVDPVAPDLFDSVQINEYFINDLAVSELPMNLGPAVSLSAVYTADENGVPMNLRDGVLYYNPVTICNRAIDYIRSFGITNNQEYIIRASLFADKLIEIGETIDESLLYPYPFDFKMHGYGDPSELLVAPWYSGMAQGLCVAVFVRLYNITGEQRYLTAAESTFATFDRLKENSQPWITLVDDAGFYWIEEYPHETSNHELNGFIFAIFGLYDYYQLKKDSNSLKYLNAAITTIHHYMGQFRHPGDISAYCLKHRVKSERYHLVHIQQLKDLYRITGHIDFDRMAQDFYEDHH